jgi:hypothetical protein
MDRRRFVFYLLLNILVSVCVTSAILFWYDRNHQAAAPLSNVPASLPVGEIASPPVPAASLSVEIVSVVGAGTLNAEVVMIRYTGEGELNLAGWQLRDEDLNIYKFPGLILYKGGAVQVHTASGIDTVVDLYWGRREPVWESGEAASLIDPQGIVRAVYAVP